MLASMSWTQWLLSVVMICVCLFLMLVILLQRGRGGGIAAAFGGGGGSGAFGAKTGDVFTWITCVVAGIFVVLAVVANYAFDQSIVPVIETPVVAEEKAPEPKIFPVQIGEDGTALPIDIGQLPEGQTQGVVPVITPTPTPAPDATAPAPAPTEGQKPAEPAAQPATPPAGEAKPTEKPAEEPATP